MAAPNIVDVTSILGKSAGGALADTSATVILNNAASSNKVLKGNVIRITNVDGTNNAEITVAYHDQDDGAGNARRLGSTVVVPADSAIDIINKNSAFYLEEDRSVVATASAGGDLEWFVSYEEIDDA